jgi:hypothetical protein
MNILNYKINSKEYIFEMFIENTKKPKVILSVNNNKKILWKIIFKNTIIEEINSLHIIKGELFCVINKTINKIAINNGNIIKKKSFGNTPIQKIIISKSSIFILLYYFEFNKQKYLSNILCIDNNLDIKWYAELESDDIYTNLVERKGNINEKDKKNKELFKK